MNNRDNPKAVVLEFLRAVEKEYDREPEDFENGSDGPFIDATYNVARRMYGIGLGETMPLTPPQAQERRTH